MFLCVSKCYQHRAEPVVVVRISVVVVERKCACIRAIIVIVPAFEERIVAVREVRVVQFNPYILFCVRVLTHPPHFRHTIF